MMILDLKVKTLNTSENTCEIINIVEIIDYACELRLSAE